MDVDTKRSLGGALMGGLVLLVGLVLRVSGSDALAAVGTVFMLGGAIVAVLCLAQVALRLIRA